MYDEVMQLIALAKNDEQYFKRIEELKKKQLEVAHVLEIAQTLQEADQHLAKARQDATEIVSAAEKEASEIKMKASEYVAEAKAVADKNKAVQKELKEKLETLKEKERALEILEKEKQTTIEEHKKFGGNPDIDVCFQYLRMLLEEDDKKLKQIHDDYRSGKILSGEMKMLLIEKINTFLKQHRENKKKAESQFETFTKSGKLAKEMWARTYE
jgi:chemotaxis regulatin CheY-phosphate phosphatase CheZ